MVADKISTVYTVQVVRVIVLTSLNLLPKPGSLKAQACSDEVTLAIPLIPVVIQISVDEVTLAIPLIPIVIQISVKIMIYMIQCVCSEQY